MNIRRKVEHVAAMVQGKWKNVEKSLGESTEDCLFSLHDITAIMDDVITHDDSLRDGQVVQILLLTVVDLLRIYLLYFTIVILLNYLM